MGGGGFMQHASDTNRKDRAQKAARREKFNGNHSEKATLTDDHGTKLEFPHLTQEQIAQERKRIKEVSARRMKKKYRIWNCRTRSGCVPVSLGLSVLSVWVITAMRAVANKNQ